MRALIELLFGCQHNNYSWPRGRKPRQYVVCWDCKQRVPYDADEMKIAA